MGVVSRRGCGGGGGGRDENQQVRLAGGSGPGFDEEGHRVGWQVSHAIAGVRVTGVRSDCNLQLGGIRINQDK